MSKNRIIVACAIIAARFLVAYVSGTASYLLFYSTIAIPVLSFAYVLVVFWRFRIYQLIETKTLVKEDKISYLFKLSNEDIITYTKIRVNFMKDYSSVENLNQSDNYTLLPGQSEQRQTSLVCHYRGEYDVGIDKVYVSDYLNLFTLCYNVDTKIRVKVAPRILHLNQLVCAPEDDDTKRQLVLGMQKSIPDVEVRNYQYGDSPRQIHWKATAKQGELLSRNFLDELKTELVLCIDLRQFSKEEQIRIPYEDQMIESALAIVDYLLRHHTPVTVFFDETGMKRFSIHSPEEFQAFYALCANVRFQSNTPSEYLLQHAMKSVSNRRMYCMLLTNEVNLEVCKSAQRFIEMCHELTVIQIGDLTKKDLSDRLNRRIQRFHIGSTDEVSERLEGIKA